MYGLEARTLIGLLILIGAGEAGQAATNCVPEQCSIFISPAGRDSWTGAEDQPFASLHRAQEEVRQLRRTTDAQIVVTLAGGTYYLQRTLVLTDKDSGLPGKPVIWRAAGGAGAAPTISGGRRITGWRLYDQERGIYRARFAGATRQFYVNGVRATRAVSPKFDAEEFTLTAKGYEVVGNSARLLTGLVRPTDLEVVSEGAWLHRRCGVARVVDIGADGGVRAHVELDQPCFRNSNLPYNPEWKFGLPSQIENAREFIDEPGEWYLDTKERWLYYKPRQGEDLLATSTSAIAPVLEELVRGAGTILAPVHDIQFSGLAFAEATWLHPSSSAGYAADQAGFRFPDDGGENLPTWVHPFKVDRTPGNISFKYAHRIEIKSSILTRLGAAAIDFDTGSQGNRIVDSKITDVSGAGIQIGGIDAIDHHPTDLRQITSDNYVADNSITYIGQDYRDTPGITVGYTARTNIEHNYLAHLPYTGISIGWGYGLPDPGGTAVFDHWTVPGRPNAGWPVYDKPTIVTGNRIASNAFDDYMRNLTDGGAVYILSSQGPNMEEGLLLERNVAVGQVNYGWIYYTDLGSRFVTMRENVAVVPSGAVRVRALGGCGPAGDVLLESNYTTPAIAPEQPNYACDSTSGFRFPPGIRYRNNLFINDLGDAPRDIVVNAGPRGSRVFDDMVSGGIGPLDNRGTSVHYTTAETPLGILVGDPGAYSIIQRNIPSLYVPFAPSYELITSSPGMTLKEAAGFLPDQITDAVLSAIDADFAKLVPEE